MGVKNTMEYMSIRHRLMDLIVTGDGSERRIPASRKLAKQFGCTHPTVLRALRALVAEGLLIPCKRGGYVISPKPELARSKMKIFGVLRQCGKQDFDTGFFESIYHALASDLLARSSSYCIREINLEMPSQLGTTVTQNSLSGLILICPSPAILQEVKKVRKKGLPVISFFRETNQMPSCCFDAGALYEKSLERLYRENRRTLLLVGADYYFHLPEIEQMIPRFRKQFSDANVTLLKDSHKKNLETISGLVRNGHSFDGIIFLLYDRDIYDFLCSQYDMKNQCCIFMDQFSIFRDMNFTGWGIHFDLSGAAYSLINAMLETPESTEDQDVKADFCFYSNGTIKL